MAVQYSKLESKNYPDSRLSFMYKFIDSDRQIAEDDNIDRILGECHLNIGRMPSKFWANAI
jgi:hypothetical protein